MKEYDASFKDATTKKWVVKLTMSKVLKFCGEHNLRTEQISPTQLNADQMARLCFIGISHHTESKGFEFEDFVDNALAGESFSYAMEATAMSIVNFSLPRMPEAQRVLMMKKLDEGGVGIEQQQQDKSP